MFLATVAHHYSFSYRPYVDLAQEQQGCCSAFILMWDVSDVRRDLTEHIHVIGSTVRRRVGPSFGRSKRAAKEEERKSLLNNENGFHPTDSGGGGGSTAGRDYQTMSSDSDHEGLTAGLGSLNADAICIVHADVFADERQVQRLPSSRDVADFVSLEDDCAENA